LLFANGFGAARAAQLTMSALAAASKGILFVNLRPSRYEMASVFIGQGTAAT
jgi:hypothetical protein